MTTSRSRHIDRRRFVASAVVGGAGLLIAGQVARANPGVNERVISAPAGSAGVAMERGNAARTGEMPGPGPDGSNGVEAIWAVESDELFSSSNSLAVGDGIVYAGSGFGGSGTLFAFGADDGEERWRFSSPVGEIGSPAVVDGTVYATGSSHSDNGGAVLYAIDASNGIERWRFTSTSSGIYSPTVVDGAIYTGIWSSNDGAALSAFDADDGSEQWRFTTDDYGIFSPAVAGGTVFAGSNGGSGTLYAVNVADGNERWRFSSGETWIDSPAVVDGTLYSRSGSKGKRSVLFAIDVLDGRERWRFSTDDYEIFGPAFAEGTIYAGSQSGVEGATLYAIDASDGSERWRFTTSDYAIFSPVVVGGTVYVGSMNESVGACVYAVDAEDGSERWRFSTTGSLVGSSAVINGTVYAAGLDKLYAIGVRAPKLDVGGVARVTETISLRSVPSSTAPERAALEHDTLVTITGEPVTAGDVTWWPVRVDETGDQGWVEASKLEPLTSGEDSKVVTLPTATA